MLFTKGGDTLKVLFMKGVLQMAKTRKEMNDAYYEKRQQDQTAFKEYNRQQYENFKAVKSQLKIAVSKEQAAVIDEFCKTENLKKVEFVKTAIKHAIENHENPDGKKYTWPDDPQE